MTSAGDVARRQDVAACPNRLQKMFSALSGDRPALITYAMAFYPDRDRSVEVMLRMLESGADALEIGIPFSDPVLDGPAIQEAGHQALSRGATPRGVMEIAAEVRGHTDKPLLVMTYYNIVFRIGHEKFVALASEAGIDGIIVPDLPTEELGPLKGECDSKGLSVVSFCSVTTPLERIREAASSATGFLYCVARLGTTGVRDTLPEELPTFLERVRANANCPIAAGIGVSNPEQCSVVGSLADGVIVGSALVEEVAAARDGFAGVSDLVSAMSRELRSAPSGQRV